jgi:hypothetical protein
MIKILGEIRLLHHKIKNLYPEIKLSQIACIKLKSPKILNLIDMAIDPIYKTNIKIYPKKLNHFRKQEKHFSRLLEGLIYRVP